MPTYEYRCDKCNHEFEVFQLITEEPLSRCPKCRGKVTRLISAGAGLIFKGSGFYITDYKKKGTGESASDSTASSDAKSKERDKKSENTKPKDKSSEK